MILPLLIWATVMIHYPEAFSNEKKEVQKKVRCK